MYQRILKTLLTLLLPATAVLGAEVELFTCSESGSGTAYFKVCVSNTGNVTLFKSPWGMEHIRVADEYNSSGNLYALEGYTVCREVWDPVYHQYVYDPRFDLGGYYRIPGIEDRYWMVMWGWPTTRIVQPTPGKFPLTIHSTESADGTHALWELKQDFAIDKEERELTITMTLYNRSGTLQRNVKLGRAVQLKIDNSGEGEEALFGLRSGAQFDSGLFGGNQDAVSVTALTTNYPALYSSANYLVGWGDGAFGFCEGGPAPARSWYSGEGEVGAVLYSFGNLAAGASRTVKFAYRAF